jgi:hypothetical protein
MNRCGVGMKCSGFSTIARCAAVLMLGGALLLFGGGCAAAGILSVVGTNMEREKKIEVPAKYAGLKDKTVAVVVNADLSVLYEHPDLVTNLVANITNRVGRELKPQNVRVMHPADILNWQYSAGSWTTRPYGEVAGELGVDRVILVDVYEYRLHPPGNRWMWEGVCAANVGIIERDGLDPDALADEFQVAATFPFEKNLTADNATASQVATGLQREFMEKVAWLFYDHEEYKYPENMR